MTVVSSGRDADALTMTFVAELDADVESVWDLWEDPRKLERWWGPPGWPATFEQHELEVGGSSAYFMTGPDGETSRGWWEVTTVDPPTRLEFDDGFADETGANQEDMGTTHSVVTFEPIGDKTRMTIVSSFDSTEQFEEMLQMGMEEGMGDALGQMDAILAQH